MHEKYHKLQKQFQTNFVLQCKILPFLQMECKSCKHLANYAIEKKEWSIFSQDLFQNILQDLHFKHRQIFSRWWTEWLSEFRMVSWKWPWKKNEAICAKPFQVNRKFVHIVTKHDRESLESVADLGDGKGADALFLGTSTAGWPKESSSSSPLNLVLFRDIQFWLSKFCKKCLKTSFFFACFFKTLHAEQKVLWEFSENQTWST